MHLRFLIFVLVLSINSNKGSLNLKSFNIHGILLCKKRFFRLLKCSFLELFTKILFGEPKHLIPEVIVHLSSKCIWIQTVLIFALENKK